MTGAILAAAADLLADGVPPDDLCFTLPAALDDQHDPFAILDPDYDPETGGIRLATLVATGRFDRSEVDGWFERDREEALEAALLRLQFPEPGDDIRQIRREIAQIEKAHDQYQQSWDDECAAADYALDATVGYATAAPAVPMLRPTSTLEQAAAAVEAAIGNAIEGRGPRHILISADRGTRKTFTAIRLVAEKAKERRTVRRRWIQDYRRDNLGVSHADAAAAADEAGLRYLRVLYAAETHALVGATVKLARENFLRAEHHAGIERPFDPADPSSPRICSQPERVKQTALAGESVPDKACGRTAGERGCPDLGGCRKWQRLTSCAHAEFVGTTIDQVTTPFLPRELTGFDLVIVDEALDRCGYSAGEVSLDWLSDRFFDPHPVLDADGDRDAVATELARTEFRIIRDIFDAAPNGYAPAKALRGAGFDRARWDRLIDLTNGRDRPSGITSATPDDERTSLARLSFRRPIRSLCMLFRQLAEPGDGWIRLDGAERRFAIVRSIAALHSSILSTRIIALDGSADVISWRRFILDLEAVNVLRPEAPHETAVQIVRPNGKHAMRKPERKAYNQAIAVLYASGSTGILTHKEHEADFVGPGIITGHHGALAGRNDWRDCSTMISFGLPFLSPEAAAWEAAGRTGEAVAPAMPVRALLPQMMKDGGVTLVPSMEYLHPAAREAQAAVRDRAAMQGPGGRPRASSRTAANPVLSLYVGHGAIPGVEFDAVVSSVEQFAPDRFVRMASTSLVVQSGRDRHRLHPDIYPKRHTAEYDTAREAGGMTETLQRVLFPAWWGDRTRPTWCRLKYWVSGRGHRLPGREAACPAGLVAWAKERLRAACGAVRFEIVGEVDRCAAEVPRMAVISDLTWILGTFPRRHRGPLCPERTEDGEPERAPDG